MPKIIKDRVNCPKCGSETYAWGHSAEHRNLQRYRCKNHNCRYQFTPGAPKRIKKYPTIFCPKCGGRMSIFKFLTDGYRFRCNNHIYKDTRFCNHKINIPLPGKSFKIAKDPIECIDTNLSINFSWNKMHYSKQTLSIAMYFAVFRSLPATEISAILKDLFKLSVSHDTITRWRHKASFNLHKNLGPLSLPKMKGRKRTFTDETVFKQRGLKRWVWIMRESRFDSDQSWFISPRRSTEYASVVSPTDLYL